MTRLTMAGFCPVILASWFRVILDVLKTQFLSNFFGFATRQGHPLYPSTLADLAYAYSDTHPNPLDCVQKSSRDFLIGFPEQ